MRKHTIFLLLALTVLAVSCDGIPDIPEMAREGIVLTLDTGGMTLTKANAGTRDGVDEFNENLLGSSVDVFFFAEEAADTEASVWHDNVAVNNKMLMIPVSISDIRAIFGETVSGSKATVLVVANYQIDHGNNYTKQQLKALALTRADWSKHPQDDFVMLSDETTITLEDASSSTPASGVVKMRRVAAKVSFRMTIADEIAVENYSYIDGNEERSIELWRPKTDAMTIYPQFFMKDAVLGGTPTAIPSDETSAKLYTGVDNPYFLVRTSEMVSRSRILFEKDDNGQYVMNPDGTYKTYVDDDVDVPIYDTYAEVLTEHDDVTNTDVIVGGKVKGPFYSYPASWDAGIQTEPFLKLIIPWQSGKDGRVKYYYYKIPFPMEAFESNNWYEITLDVQILGGEEQLPVPLEAKYHVEDWVAGSSGSTSAVSARYLSVPTTSFTMYNTETLEIPMLSSHECEITNLSISRYNYKTQQTTTITSLTAPDKLAFNSDAPLEQIDLVHKLNNDTGPNQDVTPYTITFRVRQIDARNDYYADVTIVQYPAIYISETTGGNSFIDGFFGHLSSWPSNFSTSYNGRNNYTNGYYYSIGWRNNAFNNTQTGSNNTPQYTPYGRLTFNDANGTHNLTHITVTAFNESTGTYRVGTRVAANTVTYDDYDYIIGDPRVPSGWSGNDLVPYLSNMTGNGNNQASNTSWDGLAGSIMVGTSEKNIIAPAIYFASYWSRPQSTDFGFEDAQKRCATYQEAGYPAGRWRIPTQAEVYFAYSLQDRNFIPQLFSSGYGYFASDGSVFWDTSHYGTGGNDDGKRFTPPDNNPHSVRCVYDVWYWGDEANEDTSYYDPRP